MNNIFFSHLTTNYLTVRNENCDLIDCYVDADGTGDNVDKKSTSGYVIKVFGNVVIWKS